MKIKPKAKISKKAVPSKTPKEASTIKSLSKVLNKSERIKDTVEECAEELSSVNAVLEQELAEQHKPMPQMAQALEQSVSIETKVQDAADELSIVNQALEDEVHERQILENQLIAVKAQEEAARHAAFHDPLTGLPNRVLFNDRLEHGLAQATRHGWTLAVMFIDLDQFKMINDVHGHEAGDRVLTIISDRLKETTRDDDTICRHGGDEFLYLLTEVNEEADAAVIAKKLFGIIQEPCAVQIEAKKLKLSINPSIGIAIFPKDGNTSEELISKADKAMYIAKQTQSGFTFATQ